MTDILDMPAGPGPEYSVSRTGDGQYQIGLGLMYDQLTNEYRHVVEQNRQLVIVNRTLENTIAERDRRVSDLETLVEVLSRQVDAAAAQPPKVAGGNTKPAATKRTRSRA